MIENLTLADLCQSATPVTLSPDDPLSLAIATMTERHLSSVVLVRAGRPVGIFTERDALTLIAGGDYDLDTPLETFRSPDLLTASAQLSFVDGYVLMSQRGYRHLVLVDAQGALCGLVTETDFSRALGVDEFLEPRTVADLMTRTPLTLPPDLSVAQALARMAERNISSIIVADQERAVGILTERDAIALIGSGRDLAATALAAAMSRPVHRVRPDQAAHAASLQMQALGVRRLVVEDAGGRLLGILTRYDLVKDIQGVYQRLLQRLLAHQGQDISDLRRAQEGLLEAQALTHLGSWELDLVHDRLTWSSEAYRIFGLPPATPLTLDDFLALVHPDDRARVMRAYRHSVERVEPYDIEHRVCRPDGGERWVRERGVHRTDDAGRAIRTLGTVHDMTDDRAARAIIEERTYQLGQRVKELKALYGIMRTLAASDLNLPPALTAVTELLPPAWQHPTLARVRIEVDDCRIETAGFQVTPWLQQAAIRVGTEQRGALCLAYLTAPPQQGATGPNRPFAAEEDQLLEAVAVELGRFLRRTDAERALRESEEKYRWIFESSRDGIWLIDLETGEALANQAAAHMLGLSNPEALQRRHPAEFSPAVQPDGVPSVQRQQDIMAALEAHGSFRGPWEHQRSDGSCFPTEVTITRVPYRGRQALISFTRDLTEERIAAQQQRLINTLFDSTSEGILITDADNRIVAVNPAFTVITGYSPLEAIGQDPRLLRSGHHDAAFFRALWDQLSLTEAWSGEIWNRRKNGEVYPGWLNINQVRGADGRVLQHLALLSDQSVARRSAAEIEFLSHHDPLTGLANLTLLRIQLTDALELARAEQRRLALLVMDLDRFADVVASHGHLAGDAVLRAIGLRLTAEAQPADIVARLAGDTFVIARPIDAGLDAAALAARATQALFSRPLDLSGLPGLAITASLGVAVFPEDGNSVTSLLRNAESALHGAKAAGRNGIAFYRPEMTQAARRRVEVEWALRRALAAGEFRLHYQPIVAIKTGAITAVEALIRWQHPRDGLLLPGAFIEAIEHSDLVHPVGRWVLERAVAQAREWLRLRRVRISVNISGPQIAAGTLARDLKVVLEAGGLDPELLEIEVLERILLRDPDQALDELNRVRELGVAIALDDFGTGYSSLSYLKRLPVDYLKIDQTFIRHLVSEPGDAAIVRATIAMAHNLGIQVIAEGVETEGQLNFLAGIGCDLAQGFLLCRPAAPDVIAAHLTDGCPLALPTRVRDARTCKVLIVETDDSLRHWLRQELAAQGGHPTTVGDLDAAWEYLAREDAHVLLIDHRPPFITAVPFLERARRLYPNVVRILIADCPNAALLLAAVNQGGAFKVLDRPLSARQVREAVSEAHARARALRHGDAAGSGVERENGHR